MPGQKTIKKNPEPPQGAFNGKPALKNGLVKPEYRLTDDDIEKVNAYTPKDEDIREVRRLLATQGWRQRGNTIQTMAKLIGVVKNELMPDEDYEKLMWLLRQERQLNPTIAAFQHENALRD